MTKRPLNLFALGILISALLAGCGGAAETGTLRFTANGEDFVREGFISKDGWSITFDHVYVHLTDIAAYQTDPPYDPHAGGEPQAEVAVSLEGDHTADLAQGGEDAAPIPVGQIAQAPAGHYNAIHWQMTPAVDGPAADYALVLVGTAEKDGQTVNFTLQVENGYTYTCGEYVGDQRKGLLAANDTAELEMTFHFDHIFGDAGIPVDDDLNVSAPGFDPFAALVDGSRTLTIDMQGLEGSLSPTDYQMLVDILPTLGHVGEGHCHSEVN
ncbi:MAG: DUF4382 domain-containing protein [Anaerolineae bacterium]|jgi:hypothetical protein